MPASSDLPPPSTTSWQPPGQGLQWNDGIWRAPDIPELSYPDEGGDQCFAVEDQSYWFLHRIDCLLTIARQFPPDGTLYDIGGGNGQMVARLSEAGIDAALVEPGPGVFNAKRRGVTKIIQATTANAGFVPGSLPATGAFDVLEHIQDDAGLLRELHALMPPGGRFYCTVPAGPGLWSHEDDSAGHYRRYQRKGLCELLEGTGFEVDFVSHLFTWLPLPLWLLRSLPSTLGRQAPPPSESNMTRDHSLPTIIRPIVEKIHRRELRQLAAHRPLPRGTSLLAVARRR
jgi:SAM-dependent methyltransferase